VTNGERNQPNEIVDIEETGCTKDGMGGGQLSVHGSEKPECGFRVGSSSDNMRLTAAEFGAAALRLDFDTQTNRPYVDFHIEQSP